MVVEVKKFSKFSLLTLTTCAGGIQKEKKDIDHAEMKFYSSPKLR